MERCRPTLVLPELLLPIAVAIERCPFALGPLQLLLTSWINSFCRYTPAAGSARQPVRAQMEQGLQDSQ